MLGDVGRVSNELLEAAWDYFVDRNMQSKKLSFIAFLSIVVSDGLEEQIFGHKKAPLERGLEKQSPQG